MPAVSIAYAYLPYCGAPGGPSGWLRRWNFDPALVIGLLAIAALYLLLSSNAGRPVSPRRAGLFLAGWLVVALALVSPLCSLSVSLFSARVGQCMLLTYVAAPLVSLGLPELKSWGRSPLPAAAVFALALWLWHAPGPYAATFIGPAAYWLMHLSLFGAAVWLWSALFASRHRALAAVIAATTLTSGQMGLLGALITFAPRPLYTPHLLTTGAWGLSPLADQALGGAIMWAPAGVLLVLALAFGLHRLLNRGEAGPAAVAT